MLHNYSQDCKPSDSPEYALPDSAAESDSVVSICDLDPFGNMNSY